MKVCSAQDHCLFYGGRTLQSTTFPPNVTQSSTSLTSLVQFSSVAQSCPTLCDPMNCSTPGLPVHHQLPEFTQTHIQRVSDTIQPSHPLLSPSPPAPQSLPASESFPMSQLRMMWPKYWSFSFSIIPSKEIPGLISFRMHWLDLLAVQGTLKSLLQYHRLEKVSFHSNPKERQCQRMLKLPHNCTHLTR